MGTLSRRSCVVKGRRTMEHGTEVVGGRWQLLDAQENEGNSWEGELELDVSRDCCSARLKNKQT
jgi:hypothetical protein